MFFFSPNSSQFLSTSLSSQFYVLVLSQKQTNKQGRFHNGRLRLNGKEFFDGTLPRSLLSMATLLGQSNVFSHGPAPAPESLLGEAPGLLLPAGDTPKRQTLLKDALTSRCLPSATPVALAGLQDQ